MLPYFMGERAPIWDVNARGVVFGLDLHHTRAHLFRAFLEAVAFSLRHSMEAAPQGGVLDERLVLAGGVAKSPLWRQIIADVTGFQVVCPKNDVEANLGDVVLAGVGTGLLDYAGVERWNVVRRAGPAGRRAPKDVRAVLPGIPGAVPQPEAEHGADGNGREGTEWWR